MSIIFNRASQLLTPKKNEVFFYQFLPSNNKEYFDDTPGVDKDERLKASNSSSYVNTGSIDTSAIDAYRQGVEITRSKHFFVRSIPKIHSGEPGNVIKKNVFGSDKDNIFPENYYQDLEFYDPIKFLQTNQLTYPIITSDFNELENYNFNGIIEPMPIRSVASFFSIDIPFEARSVKGHLSDGNLDITLASDRKLTVDKKYTKHKIQPWLDMVDIIGDVKKIPTIGFFNTSDKVYLDPFNDLSNKVQLSTNLPEDMIEVVKKMNSSTENYVKDGDISASTGWTYDDVWSKGTDSIAFGGFTY